MSDPRSSSGINLLERLLAMAVAFCRDVWTYPKVALLIRDDGKDVAGVFSAPVRRRLIGAVKMKTYLKTFQWESVM